MNIKIQDDYIVKELKKLVQTYNSENKHSKIKADVVGGAVIDILEKMSPKDYDLIVHCYEKQFLNELVKSGGIFSYETSTSKTYIFKGKNVQILKTKIEDFDFTISQSYVSLNTDALNIDDTFESKKLIPTSFTKPENILNSLARIPHWRNKGYDIDDVTYLSLINQLNNKHNTNILPYIS